MYTKRWCLKKNWTFRTTTFFHFVSKISSYLWILISYFWGGTLTVSYFPSIHFVIWAEKSKAKSKSSKNSLATNTDHCKFIAYLQLYKYTNKSRVLWRSWNVDLLYKLKLGAVSENVTLWKMTVAITDRKLSPTSYL